MKSLAAAVAALALLAGCTPRDRAAAPSPSATVPTAAPTTVVPSSPVASTPASTPSVAPSAAPCPTAYAAPDPARPVVDLTFTVADDKATVNGREKVAFVPDLATDRLVFRLWGNEPAARKGGGSSVVTALSVDGHAAAFTTSADRTLVAVPGAHAAGRPVAVDLTFTLTLPAGVNERLGHSGGTAWFGSGFPLLAWERGRGWATEPATAAFAEAATSESFRLTLHVDTAPGDVVLGTGAPAGQAGRVRTRTADAVRDVLVAVGPFRTARASAGGVPVTVGVAPGLADDPAALARQHVAAIRAHAARYGPFPYATLDVAVVPDVHGGIEFPAGIILGHAQDQDATLVHEVAHEWFYGLVGDDQGRDPWLDEAFATYAEALVRGTGSRYLATPVPAAGRDRVGRPMTYWEPRTAIYYRSVYVQGAAALLRARQAAGAAAFDAALRCYVAANAHRIATPAGLAAALRGLPAALAVLRRYGALPR